MFNIFNSSENQEGGVAPPQDNNLGIENTPASSIPEDNHDSDSDSDEEDDENPLLELIEDYDSDDEENDNLEEFNNLLNMNPNLVNMTNESSAKITPLMHACSNEHKELVTILLNKNANKDMQDEDGETALMYAIKEENDEIIDLLLNVGNNINLDIKNIDGDTVLMYAAGLGDSDTCSKLIQKGANISITNNDGETVLKIVENQIEKFNNLKSTLSPSSLGGKKKKSKSTKGKKKKNSKRKSSKKKKN